MSAIPIQVTDEGVLIPKVYLHNAGEVEVVMTDEYVLVRPKPASPAPTREPGAKRRRYTFIASGRTRNPGASTEAEQILEQEAHRRRGWSFDR